MLQKEKKFEEVKKAPTGGSGFEFVLPEVDGDGSENTNADSAATEEVEEEGQAWNKSFFSGGLMLTQTVQSSGKSSCGCMGD